MPAEIVEDPLGIACVFTRGRQVLLAAETADAALARDLLMGLAGLVHPHGQVDAANTVKAYLRAARHAVGALVELGHSGGAGGLTRPRLAEYWVACGRRQEAYSRRMLAAFHTQTAALPPGVAELVSGRHFNPGRNRPEQPLQPYTETEWVRLRQACTSIVEESFTRHREALAAVRRGRDPLAGGWTTDNICWLLAERGPWPNARIAEHMGVGMPTVQHSWGGTTRARTALYPVAGVVLAYRLLFGVLTGIVPDGIDGIGVGDLDWAGDATVLLGYVKGRTGVEGLTLPRPAVRLLEQWLQHSALLRGWAPPELRGQLWLRHAFGVGGPFHTGAFHRNAIPGWVARHGILDDEGEPLRIHRHRIRTTFESHRDRKAWFGSPRATIDPNHSARVEGDHYLTAATPDQRSAVEEVIAGAETDLLRRAAPPAVLPADQAAQLAARFPALVGGMELGDAAVADLVGGARDVFVAACADPLSGLHGPPGKPCPARPWVCLLCPLAVFTPRHAANLLRMKAFFTRQWQVLPSAHFMAVFGPYATRIAEVIERFDPAVLAAAATGVADVDEEIPLRPEERTR